jgi:nucleoside diphosphate kinase
MATELAYVLINPYTIAKSRTGGVIARVIMRSDLKLVGGRMFGPSRELAETYAERIRRGGTDNPRLSRLLSDYVLRSYVPDPETGRPRRVMLLVFEGENAVQTIWNVAGSATSPVVSGSTIRDTYGDYILNRDGSVRYFEPAILVAPTRERCEATIKLWASHSAKDGGVIDSAADVASGEGVQKTLVMLKPDNFRFASLRPGSIIDVLSTSGLRIVAVKKFAMTVAQAVEFYGPVRDVLKEKFESIGWSKAAGVLEDAFEFPVPERIARALCRRLGRNFAQHQFENIVQFMTGHRPSDCPSGSEDERCGEECLALVYEGNDAVRIIRDILGPTDPGKARPGSVRREFGSDIMVNAAHASDSPENAVREMGIIDVAEDTIAPLVAKYYG